MNKIRFMSNFQVLNAVLYGFITSQIYIANLQCYLNQHLWVFVLFFNTIQLVSVDTMGLNENLAFRPSVRCY